MSISRIPAQVASPFFISLWISALFSLSFPGMSSARFGDGSLRLEWSGDRSLADGTSTLLAGTEFVPGSNFEFLLIGTEEHRFAVSGKTTWEQDQLDSGTWRLELQSSDGIVVQSWEFYVRAELITPVSMDLSAGTVDLPPYSPQPFGNSETWSADELALLPGAGESALPGAGASPSGSRWLDGVHFAHGGLAGVQQFGLDQGLAGAQTALGSAPAAFDSPGRWMSTQTTTANKIQVGGSAGSSSRFLGQGWFSGHAPHSMFGWVSATGEVQWSQFENPGPSGIIADLEHNKLEMLETQLNLTVTKLGPGKARLGFYAFGNSRDYYLHEFSEDLNHSPREDRAELMGSIAYDLPLAQHKVSLEAQYLRNFIETGDGLAFDDFNRYITSTRHSQTSADGLYWAGDDSETVSDEGSVYNYYRRTLATEFRGRVDTNLSLLANPTRVGAEVSAGKWRVFEHLSPTHASGGSDSGFQLTRRFGYDLDGSNQADPVDHAAREPRRVAAYGSQLFQAGKLQLEAGLRFQRFESGQQPLIDTSAPFGDDETLDSNDLAGEESHTQIAPRIGLYIPLTENTKLWLDGGRQQNIPPYEAIYFDPDLLRLQAGLAHASTERSGRDFVFGDAGLAPEDEWNGHLGLFHTLSPTLSLQFAGYGKKTTDTWVIRSVPVGVDRLLYYDNDGSRRTLGAHMGIRWATGTNSELRAGYDLSRRQTNVVEPFPLYEHAAAEGQPLQNTASRQTALPADVWIHNGQERDYYASILDRTHVFTAVWTTVVAGDTRPGKLALGLNAASGLPYSPTFVRKEGDVEDSLTPAQLIDPENLNSERLPWNWQLNAAYAQSFFLFGQSFHGRIEVRNLTDRNNVQKVYSATGEADDDGWLDTAEGKKAIDSQGPDFETRYKDRLEDPRNYTDGVNGRVSLTVDVF